MGTEFVIFAVSKFMIMKKGFIAVALLSVCGAVFFSSCEKADPQPQYQYEATFYVGGNEGYEGASIYKDSTVIYKLDANSTISGLAAMSDGVYACGTIWDMTNYAQTPALWKDGARVDIGDVEGTFGNMVNNGTKWMCCGNFKGDDGYHGVIFENGKEVFRSETPVQFLCMDYGVSGDYYVVASDDKGLSLWRIAADTKTVKETSSVAENDGDYRWSASSIYVGSVNIIIGLAKTKTTSADSEAFCWLDGDILSLGPDCVVNAVAFADGYYVAGGCKVTEKTEMGIPKSTVAVQWVNGNPQDFSLGCTGNSDVRLLMNWQDQFFFQCVQAQGQFQICLGGALFGEVKTSELFGVSCWDATIELVPVK